MADININIGADAKPAVDAFDATANAAGNAADATQDLSASLEKQEARIKTLDGVINLLGGSVEILAGGLAATGLVTEENAEQFQAAALGAIAFADGSKRVLDGYKSLNEGLKVYGGAAKAARAAQAALNAAILANPYVAAAAAVAVLAGAIYLLSQRETEEEAANRKALETAKLRLQNLEESETRVLSFARAQGLAAETVLEFEIASNKARVAELDRIIDLEEDGEKLKEYYEEQNKLLDRGIELGLQLGNLREQERQKGIEDLKKEAEARREIANELARQTTNLKTYVQFQKDQNQASKEAVETFIEMSGGIEQTTGTIMRQLPMTQEVVETSGADLADYFNNLITKQKEFFDSEAGQAASAALNVATQFASVLRENVDESTKEGFEKGKKYRIAETRIASIQAAFEAYKGLVGVPIVGQFLAVAAAAAALAAGQKAIREIQSSTFEGSSTPSNPVSSAASPSIPGTSSQGGFLALAPPTTSAAPVRAYVVTGDVTSGQEAEAQLQTRRQFGPG